MEQAQRAMMRRVVRELERLRDEEASEVAYRLARAEHLEERGLREAATVLRDVAMSELGHLVRVTRLLAPEDVERDPSEAFAGMMEADRDAAGRADEMADVARSAGLDEEAALFARLAQEERAHVARLEAALGALRSTPSP